MPILDGRAAVIVAAESIPAEGGHPAFTVEAAPELLSHAKEPGRGDRGKVASACALSGGDPLRLKVMAV